MTCDQNHSYGPEQYAANGGKADKFVQNTGRTGKCSGNLFGEPGLVMDYYDGNTVTAMWNYAQHYALERQLLQHHLRALHAGRAQPGLRPDPRRDLHRPASAPSTRKQTASPTRTPSSRRTPRASARSSTTRTRRSTTARTTTTPARTRWPRCRAATSATCSTSRRSPGAGSRAASGQHRLDGKQGDYAKCCGATHTNVGGAAAVDYSPHHSPFQYYKSTSNPHHLPPKNTVAEIGHNGQANHNYDLTDFDAALKAGNLPAVSFLKAAEYQDGHAGYSDPIDEQHFLVEQINKIQKSPEWKDTAVVIAYDDSDGWYDHVAPSRQRLDGRRPAPTTRQPRLQGQGRAGGYPDRCGPGTRQPLLVISPYSKVNSVDHTRTEQASITRFIEDNWGTGRIGDASFDARAGDLDGLFDFRRPKAGSLFLNPKTGARQYG